MFETISSEDILFIDIETVPQQPELSDLPEHLQHLWDKKSSYFRNEDQVAADVYERAGIYAEFGKIICISAGGIVQKSGERFYKVKSFHDTDEKKLLSDFKKLTEAQYRMFGSFPFREYHFLFHAMTAP